MQRRRERTQRAGRRSTSSSVEIEGKGVSKNSDETVRHQSEKSGYQRLEKSEYKGLLRGQVALPVWPAYQPRRRPKGTNIRGPIVV